MHSYIFPSSAVIINRHTCYLEVGFSSLSSKQGNQDSLDKRQIPGLREGSTGAEEPRGGYLTQPGAREVREVSLEKQHGDKCLKTRRGTGQR